MQESSRAGRVLSQRLNEVVGPLTLPIIDPYKRQPGKIAIFSQTVIKIMRNSDTYAK